MLVFVSGYRPLRQIDIPRVPLSNLRGSLSRVIRIALGSGQRLVLVVVTVLEDFGEDRGRDVWQGDLGILSRKICGLTTGSSRGTCHPCPRDD